MQLCPNTSQLLIVDVQERLIQAMYEGERMLRGCEVLLKAANRLRLPVTISEQYPKGLGPTVKRLVNIKGDAAVMEKNHFSCASDPHIAEHITSQAQAGRTQLVVGGIESHVCVLQSALGFKKSGLDLFVVLDAVTSRHLESVDLARGRFDLNKVAVINTEMALFEWLQVSGTSEFKDLTGLIK